MLPAYKNGSPSALASNAPANRIDTFFDRFFGEDGWAPMASAGAPVSFWQDEDHFYVEADLPGVAEGDVDVTVHDDLLAIRAERKAEEGRRYLYNARHFGRVDRMIRLPGPIDSANVQASLAAGVLRLTLPKSPESKPKKITVRTA